MPAVPIVVLRSASLMAIVDPAHGGEVVDLVDLTSGTGLLGRPPFAPLAPVAGAVDEETWTRSYRGGWQLAAPNAGNASAGHPFHGAASTEPWAVEAVAERMLRLRWEGHGLVATRTLSLDGEALEVEVEWRLAGEAPAALVAVEHLTVGLAVLDPKVRLTLSGGRALELDDRPGDLGSAAPWPEVALLNGARERADGWQLSSPGARFLVVAELERGSVVAENARSGVGLRLDWNLAAMPYLWIWREARTTAGPWRESGEILGLEPATVPHAAGIGAAIADGHAVWPTAERPFRHSVRATPLSPGR